MQLVVAAASLVGDLLKARFVFVKLGSKVVPQKKKLFNSEKKAGEANTKMGRKLVGQS